MSLINKTKEFEIISNIITPKSSIIDIGCNDGSLIEYLKSNKNVNARGMEIDQSKVRTCLAKGISVVEGDADTDLFDYPDDLFDYSILTYTLQATKNPKIVLEQLVRIAQKAIVSFPNFGHWSIATSLFFNREMPVNSKLDYSWYETPNLHFCTINDFINLCDGLNIKIEKKADLRKLKFEEFKGKSLYDSYFSDSGLFLISKK
ncbi:MAG: methionine biosynthesis protein MetW [Pelagibacteraceae bacterium]|nr:methionine biosynthesis protein MetW [Pelagibacteraceae bacterium]|tara:strand:- start:753 stop:1364 length:612 start_codon:yes stop_codon:yes gene_type:complete